MSNQNNNSWIKSIALKIGSVIVVIVTVIFAKTMGLVGGSVAESYVKSKNEEHVSQILSDSLNDIRSQLPIAVDEITTLENVDLDGLTYIYEYKVDLSDFDTNQIDFIRSNIKNENTNIGCGNPDIVKVLDEGVEYRYLYHDLGNNYITSFDITKSICDNFQYQPLIN